MLTGDEIRRKAQDGTIVIDPFDEKNLNPNSYNVSLAPELVMYNTAGELDPTREQSTTQLPIPESGFLLRPGFLYLATTNEYTESHDTVPMINGRSSLARLGLVVHQTGAFGDIGFCGAWTLELSCVQPIRIYPNMPIAQICWFEPVGPQTIRYAGKYQGQRRTVASRMYREMSGFRKA